MSDVQIRNLRVEGFRRFQEAWTLELVDPREETLATLVLSGPNGCGKTSVLEALLFGLGREDLVHREMSEYERETWWSGAVSSATSVSVTLDVQSAPGTSIGAFAPCLVTSERSSRGWRVTSQRDVDDTPSSLAEGEEMSRRVLEAVPVQFFSSNRTAGLCGGVPASLPLQRPVSEGDRLRHLKQEIVSARARRGFARDESGFVLPDQEWLERLTSAWRELRGDSVTAIDAREWDANAAHSEFDLVVVGEAGEMGGSTICSVDQLSSGEVEWLTLAGTLITSNFSGVALIDEPELHLHPEWQTRLLPALRTIVPDAQLVIATHADPVWDQAYSYERRLLVPASDPRSVMRDEEE